MQNSIFEEMTESEKQVVNFLKELGLFWVFELLILVHDDKKDPRVWTPDFYLPKLGMYIKVCGSESIPY